MRGGNSWLFIILTTCVLVRTDKGYDSQSEDDEKTATDPTNISLKDIRGRPASDDGNGQVTRAAVLPTNPVAGVGSAQAGPTINIGLLSKKSSVYANEYTDPDWPKQWYMHDYRRIISPVMDLNVVPVHRMGYTGKGVTVAVMDSGVESDHPDHERNYNTSLAYDYVADKPYAKPGWRSSDKKSRAHGTKVAGVIAMAANNAHCGVGVAFNAQITGVTILFRGSPFFTNSDRVKAKGLQHRLESIDIYSNSWGPYSDGKLLNKVPHLTYMAINRGVIEGRRGLGSIYVFSAGNNKELADNCASDAMVNNPNVIAIAAANQFGKITGFSESCAAVFATTYSGVNDGLERVVTTTTSKKCTNEFGGNSAAAALASGIIALVLQANPKLTYRDVMHIIAASAEVAPLADNSGTWYKNQARFMVSLDFGFGLLNAKNMVVKAKDWINVARKNVCVVRVNIHKHVLFELEKFEEFEFETPACQDTEDGGVHYLEQIQVTSSIHSLSNINRGDMAIYITSPMGTTTTLMKPRAFDKSKRGFQQYSITSVHTWGEDPKGKWTIHINVHDFEKTWPYLAKKQEKRSSFEDITQALLQNKDKKTKALVEGFTLILHGPKEKPQYTQSLGRYAGFLPPDY